MMDEPPISSDELKSRIHEIGRWALKESLVSLHGEIARNESLSLAEREDCSSAVIVLLIYLGHYPK